MVVVAGNFQRKVSCNFSELLEGTSFRPGTEGVIRTITEQRSQAGFSDRSTGTLNGNFLLLLLDGVQKQQEEGK